MTPDMRAQLIRDLIQAAWEAGYCAAILEKMALSDTDRATYTALSHMAIQQRSELQLQLERSEETPQLALFPGERVPTPRPVAPPETRPCSPQEWTEAADGARQDAEEGRGR
jgi:hypothetical protein